MKSLTSIMYACSDLARQINIQMMDKCIGVVDAFNVKMGQFFTEQKSSMDEIMSNAINGSTADNSMPHYNYGPPQ